MSLSEAVKHLEDDLLKRVERLEARIAFLEGSSNVRTLEPWLTKRQLAEKLGCSTRWIELHKIEGTVVAGRLKYRLSAVEKELQRRGLMGR